MSKQPDFVLGHAAFHPHEKSISQSMKYTVSSEIKAGDVVEMNLMNGEKLVSQWIMNTRDKIVREALIKLGWTPPPEKP